MKYVLLRDDDTNATTPPRCLDLLYRPFLDRGLPVNLSVIPAVALHAKCKNGEREEFVQRRIGAIDPDATSSGYALLEENMPIVKFFKEEPHIEVLQHGFSHELDGDQFEFGVRDPRRVAERIERGKAVFARCGLRQPATFVPPQDSVSPVAMRGIAKEFKVISGGWYSKERVPQEWWPSYFVDYKLRARSFFFGGGALFVGHPGCLLTPHVPPQQAFDRLRSEISKRRVMVIVLHHWEFFQDGAPRQDMIDVLHELARWLDQERNIEVLRFSQLRGVLRR